MLEYDCNYIVGVRSTQHTTNGAAGPSSQIPGLSSTANNTEPEARTKGRRVGVQASDSDYVKLAKQGGQRGKLSYLLCDVLV